METYLYQNIPTIAYLPTEKSNNNIRNGNVITCDWGGGGAAGNMLWSWPRGQMLFLSYLLFIKLIIHYTMVISGAQRNAAIFCFLKMFFILQ